MYYFIFGAFDAVIVNKLKLIIMIIDYSVYSYDMYIRTYICT